MSQPEVHQFGVVPITAHSFSADKQQLAICQNSNQVQIHSLQGDGWALEHTLVDHDKLVTSIDIAPNSGRILTCSQDRNAYVWTFDPQTKVYKPTLVLLRINRAATFARWSPNEDKFAVASGARCISVCYFEQDNDWWVSKHIKKPIRSTVLSIDWHPNGVLLASGSADMKARVFSAFIKGVDKKLPSPSVWGDKLPFNTVCGDFSNGMGGWVHSVAFSPSGDALAFTGHDSSVNIAYPSSDGGAPVILSIRTGTLPHLSLLWQSETRIIAVGHDCSPMLFESNGSEWQFSQSLDQVKKKSASGSTVFNKFRQMDSRGLNEKSDTELNTTHQNSITQIRPFAGERDNITQYSTAGVDGRLVIWSFDPSALTAGMAGLSV